VTTRPAQHPWRRAGQSGTTKRILSSIASVALGLACVPQNAGYEDVRQLVSRTGHEVRWSHVHATATSSREAESILSAPLTADSAVRLALLENKDLQASFEDLGMARGDLLRAVRLPNPSAEGGLLYEENGGSPDVELSLSQDLSELILLPMRSGAAQAEFASVKLEVAGRAMDLILEVRKAFYNYLADQQILELRSTVMEALEASAITAEEIHRAGNMTDLDFANQKVLYEEARVSFSSAATALAASRERLNALLGVWGKNANWQATARLGDPDEVPVQNLEGRAVERSIELAAIRQRFAAAAKRANLARAQGLLPELKAGVAFEREAGEWSYGPIAEVEIPIFYQGQGEVARAEAQMRRERELLAAMGVRVRAALRAVQARASTAHDRALHLKNVLLPMRQRILDETQLQFNAMNTSVFQLLIARRDQIEAGRAYVEAQREYWLAAADLEQLLAGRIPDGAMAGPAATMVTGIGGGDTGGH
jgi:cobalt-zinc-cadmium efflux system outer membrane protein